METNLIDYTKNMRRQQLHQTQLRQLEENKKKLKECNKKRLECYKLKIDQRKQQLVLLQKRMEDQKIKQLELARKRKEQTVARKLLQKIRSAQPANFADVHEDYVAEGNSRIFTGLLDCQTTGL